jgi:hypothetical protein
MTWKADGGTDCRACLFCGFTSKFGKVKIMRMLTAKCPSLLAIVGLSAVAVTLCGCAAKEPANTSTSAGSDKAHSAAKTPTEPATKEQVKEQPASRGKVPAKSESAEALVAQAIKQAATKPRDLGLPLVDNLDDFKQYPEQPVWTDVKHKQVVLLGEVCAAGYPLEFFATYPNRSYEAVLSVNAKPSVVHTCLLLVGAEPGHPVKFQPEFSPPTGTEVAIEVRWKDAAGKVQSSPAQNWIRNIKTKKALDTNWVFAGSMLVTDDEGHRSYVADSGELICVLNLQGAMLDLPVRSESAMDSRIFEAFTEHLPPQGTPTTIILKPILVPKPNAPALPEPAAVKPGGKGGALPKAAQEQAEKKAVAAAAAWLALVDRGQYAQGWETAARALKDAKERTDFIKIVGNLRKPLGAVKSRQLESKQFATNLPRSPDGQYFILQYKTSFANRKSAIETVTPMLDKDKQWRVSAYDVK